MIVPANAQDDVIGGREKCMEYAQRNFLLLGKIRAKPSSAWEIRTIAVGGNVDLELRLSYPPIRKEFADRQR